jgi:hypothetical protein
VYDEDDDIPLAASPASGSLKNYKPVSVSASKAPVAPKVSSDPSPQSRAPKVEKKSGSITPKVVASPPPPPPEKPPPEKPPEKKVGSKDNPKPVADAPEKKVSSLRDISKPVAASEPAKKADINLDDDVADADAVIVRLKLPQTEVDLHSVNQCLFRCKEDIDVRGLMEKVMIKLVQLRKSDQPAPNRGDYYVSLHQQGPPLHDDNSLLGLSFGGRHSVFGDIQSQSSSMGQSLTLYLCTIPELLLRLETPELNNRTTLKITSHTTVLELKQKVSEKLSRQGFRRQSGGKVVKSGELSELKDNEALLQVHELRLCLQHPPAEGAMLADDTALVYDCLPPVTQGKVHCVFVTIAAV